MSCEVQSKCAVLRTGGPPNKRDVAMWPVTDCFHETERKTRKETSPNWTGQESSVIDAVGKNSDTEFEKVRRSMTSLAE